VQRPPKTPREFQLRSRGEGGQGELALLSWIRRRIGKRDGRIVVDSGDDCAVIRFGREDVLFKTDSVVEGVHFTARDPRPWVGHKALARPLSDVAAMGGLPVAAVAAMMMPRTMTQAQARAIYRGMERLGVPVVGGDVTTHPGRLAISVSVIGEMRGVKPVLRSGARPGDVLVATGDRFGGSLASGRHLRFTPRLAEGRRLAATAHAMIDVSDGLVRDLAHVCESSGVGAMLFADQIPCRDLNAALYDGEDYELLAAVPPPGARGLRTIGMFVRGSGVWMGGRRLPVRGYEHQLL